MATAAVITADIVNSTSMPPKQEKKMLASLLLTLQEHKFEFYRGDSFQVYLKEPVKALELVLKTRAVARKYSPLLDVRASIGIAEVGTPIKKLSTATDEAFVLSGRAFDEMTKTESRLLLRSSNPLINPGLKMAAWFGDYIFRRLTAKQAEVVYELLSGYTQQEVARKLKKSQSTVNKHVQAAGWPDISKLLAGYSEIISNL